MVKINLLNFGHWFEHDVDSQAGTGNFLTFDVMEGPQDAPPVVRLEGSPPNHTRSPWYRVAFL